MGEDVLGADFMGVDVLRVDFTALILWENGSQQGKERMFSSPTLFNIYIDGSCLMLWKNMMERLAYAAEILSICSLPRT